MPLIYDLVFLLYAVVYLPYLLLTGRGYSGFGMRFGLFPPGIKDKIKAKPNIWLHAVSVGEVMLLDGFIDLLKQQYPSHQMVVTVTTKTGFNLAQERLKNKTIILASPIDFNFVAAGFVSLIDPKIYVAVETEIWPNLYRQLYLKHIPLVVINGRISDNSYGRYKAIRFLLKGILNQVSVWCMQSETHAKRIMELGADSSKVLVTGNIKFDQLPHEDKPSMAALGGKYWWVAGSTHPGEEEIVLNVYKKIVKDNPQWRLIIAPRHVDRVPEIMNLISRHDFKAIKFSEGTGDDHSVVVVDTIGELRSLYAVASLVFVGKSLCVGGGHNVIEPALMAKPVVVGPKTENFKDIIACFKEMNAIIQVVDVPSFESMIRRLCQDAALRQELGARAREVVLSNQGASKRTLECLSKWIPD